MSTIKHTELKKPTNYHVPGNSHQQKVAHRDHTVHAAHPNQSKTSKTPAKTESTERKSDKPGFWAGFFKSIFLASADGPSANRREHQSEQQGKPPESAHHFHSKDLASPKHIDFYA